MSSTNRPTLVVVTGRPASGKTTLAQLLADKIKLPLISRDALKEGYIHTASQSHDQLDQSVGRHIYHAFFATLDFLISEGVSIMAEAAFQDKLWKPGLQPLSKKADIRIIICEVSPELAKARFANRLQHNPDRQKYHGDDAVKVSGGLMTETYEAVNMDVPTMSVDTTEGYRPDLEKIVAFIQSK